MENIVRSKYKASTASQTNTKTFFPWRPSRLGVSKIPGGEIS
jgi:hypothetical protein